MTFEEFQIWVLCMVRKSGEDIKVRFHNDSGKYIATCSDGTEILGNPEASSITVRWNGRQHMARIAV